MNVVWINGEIKPPKSGEYYFIIEAQHDIAEFKKGDIEITTDCYDADRGEWDTIGKDNPTWKVLAWARVLHPDIPDRYKDRVKMYFGLKVGFNDG